MKYIFIGKRNLTVLFAVLALAGYIAFLVLHNYRSQVDLNRSALARLQLDTRSRAEAVSYFFAERTDDMLDLAAARELVVFFSNKALGMSMAYGMRTSVIAIEQLFGRLIREKRIAGSGIYGRIVLIDAEDGPVADIAVDGAPQPPIDDWPALIDPGTAGPSISVVDAHDGPQIVLSLPYIYKGEYTGWILAWIDRSGPYLRLFGSDLIEHEGRLCLTSADTLIQSWGGDTAAASCASAADLFALEKGEPHARRAKLDDGDVSDGLVIKVAIPKTPFMLSSIADSDRVLGRVTPTTLLITMGLFALVLILVAGFALWGSLQNRLLRVSIDEARKQRESLRGTNTQLRAEIAKREETERNLREATEAKSRFLATMSHEIRTPINGIMGMTELLLGSGLSGRQLPLAENAHRSVLNLLALINDILDFSRIEADRLELEPVAFDLEDVAEDVIRVLAGAAGEKGVDLTVRLAETVPRHLIGDANRLRQILLNLIGNAVKFTERGTVTVSFDTEPAEAEEILLRCAVRDTGIGIAPDVLETIFDSFSQADNSTTRRFGGSGLGLAITKNLAWLMGGNIEVRSTSGVGSTFTFTVRLKVNPDQGGAPAGQHLLQDRRTLLTGRVLVAEDNPVNQEVIQGMLEMLGCEVMVEDDGQAACQATLNYAFDLVLMDCHMPEMNGFEAARYIREQEKGSRRVPIVALTADVQKETKGRCIEAGMDDYLSKPLKLQQLHDTLRKWLPTIGAKPVVALQEPAPSHEPDNLLDPDVLAQIGALRSQGGPPRLERVIRVYLESAPPLLDGIHTAVLGGDATALANKAHSLKSSSGNLGALILTELCKKLEAAGRENRLEDAEAMLGPLDAVYRQTLEALTRLLEDAKHS